MNKAYLQALKLELDLQDYQYIREKGIVPNLVDHIIKTDREFGRTRRKSIARITEKYGSLSDVHGGVCTIYIEIHPPARRKPMEICVIAVEESVPMIEWFSLGEEETHALEHFGKIKKLTEINDQFGLTLNPYDFTGSDKEGHYLQKLGGFFALLRQGYDLMSKEFTEEFLNKSIEIMGEQQTLYSSEVLLKIKNNIVLNAEKYLSVFQI